MEKQLILSTSPQDSLRFLERDVAQRFNWRILIGGKTDAPRFVIEKRVRYEILRGLPMYAQHKIIGDFGQNERGETTLHYKVSADSGTALMSAAIPIGFLLLVAFFGAATVGANGNAILLIGFMLMIIVVYGFFTYRGYQGQLRELNTLMEEFAQKMGIISDNQ